MTGLGRALLEPADRAELAPGHVLPGLRVIRSWRLMLVPVEEE